MVPKRDQQESLMLQKYYIVSKPPVDLPINSFSAGLQIVSLTRNHNSHNKAERNYIAPSLGCEWFPVGILVGIRNGQ